MAERAEGGAGPLRSAPAPVLEAARFLDATAAPTARPQAAVGDPAKQSHLAKATKVGMRNMPQLQ